MKFSTKLVVSVLVLVLSVFALAAPAFAAPAKAADPLANVSSVLKSGGSITINGSLPCSKWSAYAVTNVAGNNVNITVYRKANLNASCAAKTVPYSLKVSPTLASGTYNVYVNGRFRFTLTK